tara:strand:- start:29023 stop:29442 length:420 start_codon:yes stop_codon:yes gene_type:complete
MQTNELITAILNKKPILIIDDEPKIISLIQKYFEKSGISTAQIVTAHDGQEALLKLKNQEFGLVIADIVMPKKSGLEVLKELKSRAKTKKIPFVIISGNLQAEVVKQAVILGAKNIISKPFNYDLFMERIFRALGDLAV